MHPSSSGHCSMDGSTFIDQSQDLPVGSAPLPVLTPHFPDALHTAVWRNWDFVDAAHLASVLRSSVEQIRNLAESMGLPPQRDITLENQRRNYMSIIRRNWHLLPYEQLCQLLRWNSAELRYALDYDDGIWAKMGGYKPRCPAVFYADPAPEARAHAARIKRTIETDLGDAMSAPAEPPFGFIRKLSRFPQRPPTQFAETAFNVRMVYPYFLRYGDPLMGDGIDDVPEGYLAQLAACGINAIWFHGVLNKLAPWELDPDLSAGWQERIRNLRALVARCKKHGIEVLAYLNEPRALPPEFFEKYPELSGVNETPSRAPYLPNLVAMCVSTQPVKDFIIDSVRHLFEQVPELGGVFTITCNESLTTCYSRRYHSDNSNGKPCPRCEARGAEVITADVSSMIDQGMRQAGSNGKLFWYVWSTPEEWIPGIIERLPESVWVQCVSEWGKTFTRGDYTGECNEYSISVIGPSEQSLRQWEQAKQRGLRTVGKMQAGTAFEMYLIPFLPATGRVAQHVSNLADAGVNALMLGWSLGGWPSANLEVVAEMGRVPKPTVRDAMLTVATRRFGAAAAEGVVAGWERLGEAFAEFPMDITVLYAGPQCMGPANLLFAKPSGFAATMITFPYDDLNKWRGPYSEATFQSQFEKLARRWDEGVAILNEVRVKHPSVEEEWRLAAACACCFHSTANQIRFVRIRKRKPDEAMAILRDEIRLAREMFDLVRVDSRIGFEATMQYSFARFDLAEKILNCRHLLGSLQ